MISATNEVLTDGIKNQASIFVKRYLNSLTIGDTVSIKEIEKQIRNSSDYIRGVTINSFNIDGQEIAIKDFTPTSERVYPGAGSIALYSVIMGQSNY